MNSHTQLDTALLPAAEFTVEMQRYRYHEKEEDEAYFATREDAMAFARRMMLHYKYKVWLNGVELTRSDFAE